MLLNEDVTEPKITQSQNKSSYVKTEKDSQIYMKHTYILFPTKIKNKEYWDLWDPFYPTSLLKAFTGRYTKWEEQSMYSDSSKNNKSKSRHAWNYSLTRQDSEGMKQQLHLYWKITESRLKAPNCGFFKNTHSLQHRMPDFCKQSLTFISDTGWQKLVRVWTDYNFLQSLSHKDGSTPGLNQLCLKMPTHGRIYYL